MPRPYRLASVLALAATATLVAVALILRPVSLHSLSTVADAWARASPQQHAASAYYSGGVQGRLSETRKPLPHPDHKPIWPLNTRDVIMFGIAILSIFVAAGGGIGGGGVLVPLFILVGEFSTQQAVALSNMTILGGALANFSCNILRKHEGTGKPLIDWDLILVMEPATIVGALLGGYLNKLLPVWLTTTLLTVLLSLMTHKLVAKGLQMYTKESHLLPLTAPLLPDSSPAGPEADDEHGHDTDTAMFCTPTRSSSLRHITSLLIPSALSANGDTANGHGANGHAANGNGTNGHAVNGHDDDLDSLVDDEEPAAGVGQEQEPQEQQELLQQRPVQQQQQLQTEDEQALEGVLKAEFTQVPLLKIAVLVAVSAWVVVSDTAKREVACGSWRYWAVVLSLLPCVAVVTLEMRRYLLWKGSLKTAAGHAQDELKWTPVTTLVYPAISSLAGLFAGLFGVGGGIVKGPLMLELGVRPDIAAATAATMILFTAGAACVIFVHFGGLVWDYALPLAGLGFLVTLVGQLATYHLVQQLGRRSVIVFMMAALMGMATVIMYYQTGAAWVHLARHPQDLARTGHICPAHASHGPQAPRPL